MPAFICIRLIFFVFFPSIARVKIFYHQGECLVLQVVQETLATSSTSISPGADNLSGSGVGSSVHRERALAITQQITARLEAVTHGAHTQVGEEPLRAFSTHSIRRTGWGQQLRV